MGERGTSLVMVSHFDFRVFDRQWRSFIGYHIHIYEYETDVVLAFRFCWISLLF